METDQQLSSEQLERAQIVTETAKIPWVDLQRFFASGKTLLISNELDLIDAAYAIHSDDANQVERWQKEDLITAVNNEQAREWFESKALVWAVVIKPWVLIQDIQ